MASFESRNNVVSDSTLPLFERMERLPCVGRAAELRLIRETLHAGSAGRGGALVLVGEAGIGKSRLIREAAAIVRESGGEAIVSECIASAGAPSFDVWIRALRQLAHGKTAQILVHGGRWGSGSDESSADAARFEQFSALLGALDQETRHHLLLIALDDLQWADRSSLDLLEFLSRRIAGRRIVIIGAMRAEDLRLSTSLASLMQWLEGECDVRMAALEPIAATDAHLLVSAFAGGAAPSLADQLYALSEGNPFVLEESMRGFALAHALDDREVADAIPELALPASVVASIRNRLSRLDRDQRHALELCALVGKRIDSDFIAGILERQPAETRLLLEELCRHSMLRRDEQSGAWAHFAFLHDWLRDVVVVSIDAAQAMALHDRIAAGYERLPGATEEPETVGALAHHYRAAGKPCAALGYFAMLGDLAMHRYAPVDAAAAFSTAIGLASSCSEVENANLEMRLGLAYYAAGKREAIGAFDHAAQVFGAKGNVLGAVGALDMQGLAFTADEQHERAVAIWQQALDLLTGSPGASDDRARILIHMADTLGVSLGRPSDALICVRESLSLLDAHDSANALRSAALLALGRTLMRSNRLQEAFEVLDGALPAVVAAGEYEVAAEMEGAASNIAYWRADIQKSRQCTFRRRDYARLAGRPAGNRHTCAWLALLDISQGNWSAAASLLDEADAHAQGMDSPEPIAFTGFIRGHLSCARGAWQDGWNRMEQAMPAFHNMGVATEMWYAGYAARAAFRAGELAESAVLEESAWLLLEELPASTLSSGATLSQLAMLSLERGVQERWQEVAERLTPYAGQFHWNLVDHSLGLLHEALGNRSLAVELLDCAAQNARRHGMRPELILILAQQRLNQGQDTGNASAGMRRETLQRREIDASRSVEIAETAGLSAREVEVLALIAEGQTNKEIALCLGIAEKTVTNHITHILDKTNLENRAAAAAFAVRQGIV